jgi:hypothetical protein
MAVESQGNLLLAATRLLLGQEARAIGGSILEFSSKVFNTCVTFAGHDFHQFNFNLFENAYTMSQ